MRPAAGADPLGAALEIGLGIVVAAAPLPFGAVTPGGRLALEIACAALLALASARAVSRGAVAPPRLALAGCAGLLALGLIQAVPLGDGVVGRVAPASLAVRTEARPAGEVARAEAGLLGAEPATLEPAAALSVSPGRTLSAVRTGAALAALLLVACAVAAERGPRGLALGLLAGAAFQGLYGSLVLISGSDAIWGIPKRWYLDSATGTFVNRNHFAGYLAMALPVGAAWLLSRLGARRGGAGSRAEWVGRDGARIALGGLAAALGLVGLLLSFSRAGTALGLAALAWTAARTRRGPLRASAVAGALLLLVAAVPLLDVGADRLAARYARTADDLVAPGGRATVWRDTLDLARRFPLAGTGFGTFEEAYPLARSPEVRLRYEHAHDDPLQALAEGGAIGASLLALLLVPVAWRAVSALSGRLGPAAVGVGAASAAASLHALVDFNLHIPANAAVAAALAGSLLGLPEAPARPTLVRPVPRGRTAFLVSAAGVLLAALGATALGADAARIRVDPRDLARGAFDAALERGVGSEAARAELRRLRRRVGARPLDAAARVAYASAAQALASSTEDLAVAAFHARRAAAVAPVTVPVQRPAALVLARSDARGDAIAIVRGMFAYDPAAAARLLDDLAPSGPEEVRRALPDRPAAWLGWQRRLREDGSVEAADAALETALARWPRDLAVVEAAAARAVSRRDWTALDRALDGAEEPRDARHARLLAYRALGRAARGRDDEAREDVARMLSLGPEAPGSLVLAGDVEEALGDAEAARRYWSSALWRLPARAGGGLRLALLRRLARIEDRSGGGAAAVRAWRAVLEAAPGDAEARGRLETLLGVPPS